MSTENKEIFVIESADLPVEVANKIEIATQSNAISSMRRDECGDQEKGLARFKNELSLNLKRVYTTPHKIVKVALLAFILMSICFAAYTTVDSILSYFEFSVITTTRILFQTPAPFPRVTICNYNTFTSEQALNMLIEINKEVSPNISAFDGTQMESLSYNEKATLIFNIYAIARERVYANNFSDTSRQALSHSLSDILLECNFNGEFCTASDFEWYFDPNFGNCYVFNSAK